MNWEKHERKFEIGVAALWTLGVIIAAAQHGFGRHQNNNFLIFRAASQHLVHGLDLYAAYPAEHKDFFKYSPTFALLFWPLSIPPFFIALLLWNALNAGVLWVAIGMTLPRRTATVARALVFLDMLGSMQNGQSNPLVAGLIVLTFAYYEREQFALGNVSAAIGGAVKIFPLASLSFALLRPHKMRAILTAIVAGVVVLALPLLVTPFATLMQQYHSWRALEALDAQMRGWSVMQMSEQIFHQGWPNLPFQVVGVVLLLAPVFARRDQWDVFDFRMDYLCSVLLFCIVFNHKAESPTFIVSATGFAIWFARLEKRSKWDWALFWFWIVCTSLASSEAMPVYIQRNFFDAYRFKAVPSIVLWCEMQRRLWLARREGVSLRLRAELA